VKSFADRLKVTLKEEFPNNPPWKAFAKWWLIGKGLYARGIDGGLVDGAKDGGFDVVAWPQPDLDDSNAYVIQSKYFKSAPSMGQISRFLGAVNAILGPRPQFDDWIESVRDDVVNTYERLRDRRRKVKFVLLTTGRLNSKHRKRLERIGIHVNDREDIQRLHDFYLQGQTPRVDSLTLRANSRILPIKETHNERLLLFSVPLNQISRAYRKYGNLLFAGNIRMALRGEAPKKVRDGIDQTLKDCPQEFVFSHNGITMVARSARVNGKRLFLSEPSIVNGAQTATHIGRRWGDRLAKIKASVLVKLVEVLPSASFEKLERDIAIRSNTQNKVDFSDLVVSEPSLVTLQRDLLRRNVFLERRKGEPPPGDYPFRTSKERLVQLLACLDSTLGPSDATRKQDLFKRGHALRLLREHANGTPKIDEVASFIWLDSILRRYIRGYENPRRRRRASTAGFAVFAATVKALHDTKSWKDVPKAMNGIGSSERVHFEESLGRVFGAGTKFMLRRSKGAKPNEPAFYKNKEQTRKAIKWVVPKIRKYAREVSLEC
jgi:hypothetical protein